MDSSQLINSDITIRDAYRREGLWGVTAAPESTARSVQRNKKKVNSEQIHSLIHIWSYWFSMFAHRLGSSSTCARTTHSQRDETPPQTCTRTLPKQQILNTTLTVEPFSSSRVTPHQARYTPAQLTVHWCADNLHKSQETRTVKWNDPTQTTQNSAWMRRTSADKNNQLNYNILFYITITDTSSKLDKVKHEPYVRFKKGLTVVIWENKSLRDVRVWTSHTAALVGCSQSAVLRIHQKVQQWNKARGHNVFIRVKIHFKIIKN